MKQRDMAAQDRSGAGRQNQGRNRPTSAVGDRSAGQRGAPGRDLCSDACRSGAHSRAANSGRAEAILARSEAALDARAGARRADRATTSPGSSASSAARRHDARRARSPPSTRSPARSRGALGAAPAARLTVSQRQALVRAAIASATPAACARSAARPGFAPALDAADRRAPGGADRAARVRRPRRRARRRRLRARARRLLRRYVELRDAQRARRRGDDPRRRRPPPCAPIPRPGAAGRCSSTASTTSRAPSSSCSTRSRGAAR